jgi:hypothetical protein
VIDGAPLAFGDRFLLDGELVVTVERAYGGAVVYRIDGDLSPRVALESDFRERASDAPPSGPTLATRLDSMNAALMSRIRGRS